MLKSRLALTALIAVGAMMSGTGATLAVTGSSGSGSAEKHQYTTPTTETIPTTETETVQTTSTTESQPTLAPQQVAGDRDEGGDEGDESPSEDSGIEPSEQVEVAGDSDESLPFTGFLAIPLLLGGVAMIATGGVLRHRSRDSE